MTTMIPVTRGGLSPFTGLREFESRMNQLLSGFADVPAGTWAPAVDLREEKDHFVLEADLPGLKREDIDVSVVGEIVTLKGKRSGEEWKQGDGFRSIERSYGEYQRAFRIRGGVDAAKVEATYDNGVLRVILPKPEHTQPRQIEVKVSNPGTVN
jgi:HSP20 family protein